MKKMIYIRNSLIIILCITIILMAVGFIVLSIHLKEEADKESSFDISFVSSKKMGIVKGGAKEPVSSVSILKGGKEVEMEFTLNASHDELTYVFTIRNDGTMPAKIVNVMESPDYKDARFQKIIDPIEITLSDIEGKVVSPGESINLKVVVYYPGIQEEKTITFPYKIGFLAVSE